MRLSSVDWGALAVACDASWLSYRTKGVCIQYILCTLTVAEGLKHCSGVWLVVLLYHQK